MKARLLPAIGLALFTCVLLSGQAHADDHDTTVSATVSAQAISVSVSPTSINYGTVQFGDSRSSLAAVGGPITFTATNTGNVIENFSVKGTDASGDLFSWALVSSLPGCGPVANNNKFKHTVTRPTFSAIPLTLDQQDLVAGVAPSAGISFNSEIFMPCAGSAGSGKVATTSIIIVATAP